MNYEEEQMEQVRNGTVPEEMIRDLLDRKAASDRADRARDDFLRMLHQIPADQVANEVDSSHGLLSPIEADILKRRAQAMIDKRMNEHHRALEAAIKDVGSTVDDARAEGVELEADLETLTEEVSEGLMDLDDAMDAFSSLTRVIGSLERRREELMSRLETLRKREEDPEAYFRQFERRYPGTRLGLGGPPKLPSYEPTYGPSRFRTWDTDPNVPPTKPLKD